MNEQNENLCTNIFKGGVAFPSKDDYTKKWIEIINSAEKSKEGTIPIKK